MLGLLNTRMLCPGLGETGGVKRSRPTPSWRVLLALYLLALLVHELSALVALLLRAGLLVAGG